MFSRVEETHYAVNRLFRVAFNQPIVSVAAQDIVKVALQKRAVRSAEAGQVADTIIPVTKVWAKINQDLQEKFKGELTNVPIKTLLDWAVFGHRLLSGGRPQDPTLTYLGVMEFLPPEAEFDTADTWMYRVFNSKDTQLQQANKRKRPKMEQQVCRLSSVVTIHRPQDMQGRVNWFSIMHEYQKRRIKMRPPEEKFIEKFAVGSAGVKRHEPYYLYPVNEKPSRSYTSASMSTRTLNLMRAAGAIEPGSPLKSEHLRHTALSLIHQFRFQDFEEVCANARHSVETAVAKYVIRIDEHSRQHIKELVKTQGRPPNRSELLAF